MTVLSTDGIYPLGSSLNADRVPREVVRKAEDASQAPPFGDLCQSPLSDRRWKVLPWGGGRVARGGGKARPRLADRHTCGLGETLSLEGG